MVIELWRCSVLVNVHVTFTPGSRWIDAVARRNRRPTGAAHQARQVPQRRQVLRHREVTLHQPVVGDGAGQRRVRRVVIEAEAPRQTVPTRGEREVLPRMPRGLGSATASLTMVIELWRCSVLVNVHVTFTPGSRWIDAYVARRNRRPTRAAHQARQVPQRRQVLRHREVTLHQPVVGHGAGQRRVRRRRHRG